MYINETTSTLADLISKLDTFLTGTAGWTSDVLNLGAGKWGVSRTGSGYDVHFAMQWDTGTPQHVGVYQYLGAYNGGLAVYAQADDSGNGAQSTTNATLLTSRHVTIGNAPVQYWCFADDVYFHVVVEVASGFFVHFGAGQLAKFGDWTGGEYVYGHRNASIVSGSVDIQVVNSALLDGLSLNGSNPSTSDMEIYVATIHVEGLVNQVSGGKYAVHMGAQGSGNLGSDRQGSPKARTHFVGSFRAGPHARQLSRFDGSDLSGHVPFYPMVTMHWERSTGNFYGPMGYMKDVRGASIRYYSAGDEIVVGDDTWVIFPTRSRWISGSYAGTSEYQGIVYRKIP